jgi:parvulin-like peptidyl-prolyl isomerase
VGQFQEELAGRRRVDMKRRLLPCLLAAVLALALSSGCSKKESGQGQVVATVGSRSITLDQLEDRFESTPEMYKPKEEGIEGLRKFLDVMIEKDLLAQAAEDTIGELNPRQKVRLENRTNSIIYEIIEASELQPDTDVTDEEIRDFYEKRKTGYRPRQIVVKSLSEANDIMNFLSEGAVFEALAMQKSIDRNSYQNGGDMGFISAGDTYPEIEAALRTMKVGETAGPIKTQLGYHILRLEDQRQVTLPPLDDDLKEQIKMMILTRRGIEAKTAFLDKVKEALGVKYDTEAVRLLDRRFTSLWANDKFKEDPASIGTPGADASGWFPEFTDEDRNLDLITIGDSTITMGQWIDKMKYAPAIVWPKGGGDEWVKKQLDNTYMKDMIVAYGLSKGMRDDPEVLRRRALSREEMLVNTFYFTRIDTISPPREDEMWDYYEKNIASYSLPEDFVQATMFHFKDEAAAVEALARWRSGERDDVVYKPYKEAGTLDDWQPNARLYRGNTEAELFDACWKLEAGDFFGPVVIFGDYIIGRMEGKTPAGPIPWEYAKDKVRTDMIDLRKEALLQEVLAGLKTKYPVKINESVLAGSRFAQEMES